MNASAWIPLALLSGFLMAVVGLVDKYVLTQLVKSALVPLLVLGLVGLVPGLAILGLGGGTGLTWPRALLGLAAGLSFLAMGYFYFRAAQVEEISRVIPLFYLSPILVAAAAYLLLGEHFPPRKYLGIAGLILGAFLVTSRWPPRFRLNRAFRLMLLAAVGLAAYGVATKYLLDFTDYWTVLALARVGMFLGVVPLLARARHVMRTEAGGRRGLKVVGLMAANEVLALAASLFFTMAAARGPIALVNALTSTQPVFVFLLGLGLTLAAPRILREDIRPRTLTLKVVSLLIMSAGLVMVL
jgi:drug/metabolite transporter (DMT)-like permease